MKKILLTFLALIGFALAPSVHAAAFPVSVGGTGATTFPAGNCLTGNGTSPITSVSCASTGSYPFTPSTGFGVNTSATSTALQSYAGIQASSTSYFTNFISGTTATSTIGNFGGVLDAYAFKDGGEDMCKGINDAYAALPSNGGKITVPTGRWNCTTPIVFGVNNKVVILQGAGHGGPMGPYPTQVGGTTIYYSPTTGDAITVNTNYSNARSMIQDISIQGPSGTTANTNKGVVFGGSNGAFYGTLEGVHVSGFGTGVYYGAYTSFILINNSAIDFNGRNISEPDTAGQNCENMRITNSVIADANNQAGGATDLYGFYVQESGNCQWNIVNTSIDDNQVYIDQFGGVANVWTFTNVHFENPNIHDYRFVDTITNVPATEVNFIGGDLMNDKQSGMASFISMGGDVHFDGTTINGNSDVTVKVTAVVAFDNANNNATASWVGLKNNGNGATYIYGTVPMSPFGYGTGLPIGPSINMGLSTPTANGTTTIANLSGILDASTFASSTSDIGTQVNAAYAALPSGGGIITIPNGDFYFTHPIVFGVDGKRVLLKGAPGEGTRLFWNTAGAVAAITINTGIQDVGINHTTGNGISGIYLHGFSYSTTTLQVGVKIGGTNGCDGCVLDAVNVFGFGYGIETGANTYHFMLSNSTIRDNGQNIHIDGPANNSGESMDFVNDFIVDGANNNPVECFYIADYSAATININGGSIDDCQLYIGNQILNVTLTGVHMENAGPTWGKYTFINIWDSSYTNLVINGGAFVNDNAATRPDQFIFSNGAGVVLNGLTLFNNGGTTVPNLVVGGHAVWSGLNNTNGGITYIIGTTPFTSNGSTATNITNLGKLGIGTSTPASIFHVSNGTSATTTVDIGAESITAQSCFNVRNNTGAATSFYFVGTTMIIEAKRCN